MNKCAIISSPIQAFPTPPKKKDPKKVAAAAAAALAAKAEADAAAAKKSKKPKRSSPKGGKNGVAAQAGAKLGKDGEDKKKKKGDDEKKQKKKKKKKQPPKPSMTGSLLGTLGMGPEPEHSTWLTLRKMDHGAPVSMGRILVGVEILSKKAAEAAPNGLGQEAPNEHPPLPPPTGRIDFTQMWNPLYMIRACVGKQMACEVCRDDVSHKDFAS